MKEPQQVSDKVLRIMIGLGLLLPFLVASYTCQLISSNPLGKFMLFSTVFLFAFLSFWIVANTIRQLLEE